MTSPTRLVVISTGGTIEKTFDAHAESLANQRSVLDHMLGSLRLPDLEVERVQLMNKDSLDMTEADHLAIAHRARSEAARPGIDGVVVVHGTSRLAASAEATVAAGPPERPIVFTGAMRPYEVRESDALQNLTEALLAARLLAPGVYVAMHGRALAFPGPRKNDNTLTFVKDPDSAQRRR